MSLGRTLGSGIGLGLTRATRRRQQAQHNKQCHRISESSFDVLPVVEGYFAGDVRGTLETNTPPLTTNRQLSVALYTDNVIPMGLCFCQVCRRGRQAKASDPRRGRRHLAAGARVDHRRRLHLIPNGRCR